MLSVNISARYKLMKEKNMKKLLSKNVILYTRNATSIKAKLKNHTVGLKMNLCFFIPNKNPM